MGKTCKRCDLHKDTEDFNVASRNPDGLQSYCKKCNLEYAREYKLKNPGVGTDQHCDHPGGNTAGCSWPALARPSCAPTPRNASRSR